MLFTSTSTNSLDFTRWFESGCCKWSWRDDNFSGAPGRTVLSWRFRIVQCIFVSMANPANLDYLFLCSDVVYCLRDISNKIWEIYLPALASVSGCLRYAYAYKVFKNSLYVYKTMPIRWAKHVPDILIILYAGTGLIFGEVNHSVLITFQFWFIGDWSIIVAEPRRTWIGVGDSMSSCYEEHGWILI